MIIYNEFNEDNNYGVAMYSQPPQKRIVGVRLELTEDEWQRQYEERSWEDDDDYNLEDDYGPLTQYFLSFPTIVFGLVYQKSRDIFYQCGLMVAFSDKKNKKYYYPNIYNIGEEFGVCVGTMNHSDDTTLESLFIKVVSRFWLSEFNSDIEQCVALYQADSTLILSDFDKWEKKTKKKPAWFPKDKDLIPIKNDEFFKSLRKRVFRS